MADGMLLEDLNNTQIEALLNVYKEHLINISKIEMESFLNNHPILSTCHNKTKSYYNVSLEKQSILANNFTTYKLKKSLGMDVKFTWNSTGDKCEEWAEEEAIQLLLEIDNYVHPIISKQQDLELAIKACTTIEELDAIEISYDEFIPKIGGIKNEEISTTNS
jgi:hypothetical protein